MKGKFLFTAALAALTVGCSQEELETPMAEVGNRIAIETPVVALGNDTQTRMTTDGNAAKVKWEDGDGFGAMVVDVVNNLASNTWAGKYTITPANKASNYLFRYDASSTTFTTDAAMVEGNYVFYAPFNESENTRNSLIIKTPTEQNVTPGVVNSAVTEFYEAATYPVFLAYKALKADDPEKKIEIDMQHIFATPLITLDNQYKTGAGTQQDPYVYHDLNVYKVEFTLSTGSFMEDAYINNQQVINAIKEGGTWATAKHENAATSNLYTSPKTTTNKITINFGEGLTIEKQKKAQFAVILPAENYASTLKATVYVKVNGEEKKFNTSFGSAEPLCLNPGFPYPAQEYNADGSLKVTKGTSATYTLQGTLVDVTTPVVVAEGIENEQQLIDYINNVAYRGQNITQVTGSVTNPGLEFNIKAGSTITLTDAFLNAVKNSLIVNGTGTLTFVNNSQIRLGAISQDRTLGGKIIYGAGAISVAGNYTIQDGDDITVESGTVSVPAGIAYTIINNGGTLNVAGAPDAASTITNVNTGVININGDTDGNLTINNNGAAGKTSVINIAAGKTVKSTITNSANGKIYNAGYLYGNTGYIITNSGEIEVTDVNAGIQIVGNGGTICNNVQCPYVTVSGTKTIYCNLTSVPASIASNINTVNLSGSITFAENVFAGGKVFANVKTVNVANGTVITSTDMNGAGLNVTFNFGTNCIWKSDHPMVPVTISNFTKTGTPDLQNVTWS